MPACGMSARTDCTADDRTRQTLSHCATGSLPRSSAPGAGWPIAWSAEGRMSNSLKANPSRMACGVAADKRLKFSLARGKPVRSCVVARTLEASDRVVIERRLQRVAQAWKRYRFEQIAQTLPGAVPALQRLHGPGRRARCSPLQSTRLLRVAVRHRRRRRNPRPIHRRHADFAARRYLPAPRRTGDQDVLAAAGHVSTAPQPACPEPTDEQVEQDRIESE
jgi:hypothetical protein